MACVNVDWDVRSLHRNGSVWNVTLIEQNVEDLQKKGHTRQKLFLWSIYKKNMAAAELFKNKLANNIKNKSECFYVNIRSEPSMLR